MVSFNQIERTENRKVLVAVPDHPPIAGLPTLSCTLPDLSMKHSAQSLAKWYPANLFRTVSFRQQIS